MEDIIVTADRIFSIITQSRLNEIALLIKMDYKDAIRRIGTTLIKLQPGAYLLGTGPATTCIVPLVVEEVVLGRLEVPGEEYSEILVDCHANDTIFFSPREVSRAHAKVLRQDSSEGLEFRMIDLESTCGTYINGERLNPGIPGRVLQHLDLISLGPAHASTYIFISVTNET